MPDYVRVKHAETKHHYTVSRAKAMTDPKLTIIDAPAVDVNGRPLPPKAHQSLAEAVDKPKPKPKPRQPRAAAPKPATQAKPATPKESK